MSSFINDIDDSNTINGKTIFYLTNKNDLSINPTSYPNLGYLALVNCTNMFVENIHLNTQGILLAWTTNSQITNNDISSNYGDGLILNYASNNKITKNNIKANRNTGISFSYSNLNSVSGNSITGNGLGIFFAYSSSNTITENEIANQGTGIDFHDSSNNFIYNNNFFNNSEHVHDAYWEVRGQPFFYVLPSENSWDNGYPIGGNFWSNYSNQYPDAKELVSSGIWDMPYFIDENNQDRYPLLNPLVLPPVQVVEVSDGETPITPTEGSFPTILVLALTVSAVIVGIGLLVYFKKHKRSLVKNV